MKLELLLPPKITKDSDVKHLNESENGWLIAESKHFRILHNSPKDTIETLAKIAEETRSSVQEKWFGTPLSNWPRRLVIRLFPDHKAYTKATGSSPLRPGYATIRTEDAKMIFGQIDLHVDKGDYLSSVLPHEVTHTVIGCNFSKTPRWADEGMAMLSESQKHVAKYLKSVSQARRQGSLMRLAVLLQLKEYPADAEQRHLFYCQSASLVDFLAKRHSTSVFIQFIRDSYRQGYISAIKQNYGFETLEELEERWIKISVPKKRWG